MLRWFALINRFALFLEYDNLTCEVAGKLSNNA